MIIQELISALEAGSELKNSANWKNRQMMVNAIVAVAALIVTVAGWCGIHLKVTQDDLMAIAGGIAVVLGMFNAGVTVTTSTKVGLPPRSALDSISPEHTDNG